MRKVISLDNKINAKLSVRKEQNSIRSLSLDEGLIDFYSNDYLGFSKSLKVEPPSTNGSTGSRLLSGNSKQFQRLEQKLAQQHKADAALIFNSGYDANIGLFSCIADKEDTVIYDQYIHASIRDGLRLSSCRSFAFKHNNLSSLEQKLQQATGHIIVVVESIYSMDGDRAPLEEIIDLSEQYKAHVIVDEAHATGVIDHSTNGLTEHLKLEEKVFARIHTFGKALGIHGAVVLGSRSLREYLYNFARSFIYTTALSEHSLLSIEAAYTRLDIHKEEQVLLRDNIILFKSLLSEKLQRYLIDSDSPIQCFIIPGNTKVKAIEQGLLKKGIGIKAIRHPTVEKGKERIRLCLHSFNTETEIKHCLQALEELIQ